MYNKRAGGCDGRMVTIIYLPPTPGPPPFWRIMNKQVTARLLVRVLGVAERFVRALPFDQARLMY